MHYAQSLQKFISVLLYEYMYCTHYSELIRVLCIISLHILCVLTHSLDVRHRGLLRISSLDDDFCYSKLCSQLLYFWAFCTSLIFNFYYIANIFVLCNLYASILIYSFKIAYTRKTSKLIINLSYITCTLSVLCIKIFLFILLIQCSSPSRLNFK